jgi:WD40 repeat protein
LWDTDTGRALRIPGARKDVTISSFDITQAGAKTVAVTASDTGRITAWDVKGGEILADLDAVDAASQVTVSSVADRTIIAGVGDSLRVWDVTAGQPLWQAGLPDRTQFYLDSPRPLIYSSHGLSAVLWWDSSASQTWELFTGRRLPQPSHRSELGAAAVATVRGQAIGLLGTEEGSILTWDLRTGKRLHAPLKCGGAILALAIRTRGNETTVLASGGGLYEWNLVDGQFIRVAYEDEWVSAIADITVANERMQCVGFNSGRVHVPDLDLTLELDEPIENIWEFSGDRILAATATGLVAIRITVQGS